MKLATAAALLTVTMLQAAATAAAAAATAKTRDLSAIHEQIGALCTRLGRYGDSTLRPRVDGKDNSFASQLCDSNLEDRMLIAKQKIEIGRSYLDLVLKSPPVAVRGAGIMNEFIFVERELNSFCRDATTDDENLVSTVCNIRDRLAKALNKRGYCYGLRGQIDAERRWHRCASRSLR